MNWGSFKHSIPLLERSDIIISDDGFLELKPDFEPHLNAPLDSQIPMKLSLTKVVFGSSSPPDPVVIFPLSKKFIWSD